MPTLSQRLDTVFENLKFSENLNVAFGFMLKDVEDGACRCCYAHENNTLVGRSKAVETKTVLVKFKNVLSNTELIEACLKGRASTKQKFHKVTQVLVCLCCFTQRNSNGVRRRSTARATYKKPHC